MHGQQNTTPRNKTCISSSNPSHKSAQNTLYVESVIAKSAGTRLGRSNLSGSLSPLLRPIPPSTRKPHCASSSRRTTCTVSTAPFCSG
jgi:hypothetical protein